MKSLPVKRLIGLIAAGSMLSAEMLSETTLLHYLNATHPKVALTLAQAGIARQRHRQAAAPMDLALQGLYEQKAYPLSTASFARLEALQELGNGLMLRTGYRRAEGVQEYSNIKTGAAGEFTAGVKLTLFELFAGVGEAGARYRKADLAAEAEELHARRVLQIFYFEAISAYYTLLHSEARCKLRSRLVDKAQQRERFIAQKVQEGYYPAVAQKEAYAARLGYEQELWEEQSRRESERLRLAYLLNAPAEALETLPALPEVIARPRELAALLAVSRHKRVELQRLAVEDESVAIEQRFNATKAFPEAYLALDGVYDLYYKEGYKLHGGVRFPLLQNAYKGKREELFIRKMQLKNEQSVLERNIETRLKSLVQEGENLTRIAAAQAEQVEILQELLKAQEIRFAAGEGTLMALLQREIALLKGEEHRLSIAFNRLLNTKALLLETGELPAAGESGLQKRE